MAIPLRKLRRKREAEAVEETAPASKRRRLPRPGKRIVAGGVTAVVIAAIAGAALVSGGGGEPEASTNASLEFASVRRTDLVSVRSFDGEIGSKAGPNILGRVNGTITWLAEEGSKVERGQPLYAVDGLPVLLFYGTTPAFRDFAGSITGEDVRQLEENLAALGFDPGTVDSSFTTATQTAIKSWQDSVDFTQDGVVRLGRIVFAPMALTVSEHLKDIGAAVHDGEDVMSTVSSERVATITLENADDLASGDEVTIILPDNSRVEAKVSSVETPPAATGTGETSTVATVMPNDANALTGSEDGADVEIELIEDSREDVLVVPVTALVARRSGGYAVEVDRGNGRTELVTVEPGLYADDLVEIDGDVQEGDRVVVP